MLVRQVMIPTSPEELWDALTEPESLSAWFGSQVEWDLRPGGRARFLDDDGSVRAGVIETVERARHLQFRWWPEDQGEEATSEVEYDLEAEEDGTRLTVTERQLPAPSAPATATATACACSGGWDDWDNRLFRCWARAGAPAVAVRARG